MPSPEAEAVVMPFALDPPKVRRVGVVGTGVIGSGWAAIFAARGYETVAYVRSEASEAKFLHFLQAAWLRIHTRGLADSTDGWKQVKMVRSLSDCVSGADYVQESVVEELKLKQDIIKQIDTLTRPGVLIGTSSSFIPLSLVRRSATRHPERIATAHPTLPSWDSFVEVLGSSPAHTAWLKEFFGGAVGNGVGMDVVCMNKEMHGHVLNATLNCLLCATGGLLHSGVASAEDLDRSLVHMARCILASGGLTGVLVGLVGDGSTDAQTDLAVDIVLGCPTAIPAVGISWCLPRFLANGALTMIQAFRFLSASQTLKGLARRLAKWFLGPFHLRWDAGVNKDFEEIALKRMRALEDLDNGATDLPPAQVAAGA